VLDDACRIDDRRNVAMLINDASKLAGEVAAINIATRKEYDGDLACKTR
jgi:hypothetical protein